ncbi:hypothetical protein [Phycicoccus avicenniae]|uniref:hypothetical protein n=1 Tax=Phycicoccus avicenniae TaxID=2828860 RepID=UPI003D278DCF
MSTSDDDFRDPTAPPPLPEDAPSHDTGAADAPAGDDTQVVGTDRTRPFEPPSTGYEPPTYAGPTYSTPSYEQPDYGTPSYGTPAAPPPAAPAGSTPPPAWPPAPTPYPNAGATQPPSGAPAPYAPPPPGGQAANPYDPSVPAAGAYPYGAPPSIYGVPQRNTSALVLTILSGLLVASCCGALTLPALILGIIGLTKQSDDPEGSRRMSRYGWIAFTVAVVLTVVGIVVLGVIGSMDGGSSSDSTFDGY